MVLIKLSIKRRLLLLMVLGSVLSFVFLGSPLLYGMYGLWDTISETREKLTVVVTDYSRDFAREQAQERIVNEAEILSQTAGDEANNIKADVQLLSDELTEILQNRQSYSPRMLPRASDRDIANGKPYVHYSPALEAEGITPAIEQEIGIVSNIAETMEILGQYYVRIYIGSQHGYTLFLDNWEESGDMSLLRREQWRTTYDARKRDWYRLGLSTSAPAFTDVYNSISGEKIFSCVMPYYDNQGVAGIIGVDCLPKNFFWQAERGKNIDIFIINKKGKLLLNTMPEDFFYIANGDDLRKSNVASLAYVSKRMTQGNSGYHKMYINGKEYYLSYAPIKETNWSMGMLLDNDQVMQDAAVAQKQMIELMDNFYTAFIRLFGLIVLLFVFALLLVFSIIIYGSNWAADRFYKPIRSLMSGAKEIAQGNFRHKISVQTGDEWENLAANFNTMTDELEQYSREIAFRAKEKSRIEAELSVANHIQSSLLPAPLETQSAFQLAADMKPAREIGGDFYDYYLIGNNQLVITIGDVSEKGIPAALFMAGAKTVLKNYISVAVQKNMSLAQAVAMANSQLTAANRECFFVTVFAGLLNISTGELIYVNAGHNQPIILEDNHIFSLPRQSKNIVLGVMEEASYEETAARLKPGATIVCYTDGVTDAVNPSKEKFSIKRLEELLGKLGNNTSPQGIIEAVEQAVLQHVTGNGTALEQSDDITMLVLNLLGSDDVEEKKIIVPAQVNELLRVNEFINELFSEAICSERAKNQLLLVVEEIFVNIAEYAYKDKKAMAVIKGKLFGDPPEIQLSFIDEGIPYNPLEKSDPNLDVDLDDRPIGGLGIFLVKKKVDDITYERKDNKNILTIRKKMI